MQPPRKPAQKPKAEMDDISFPPPYKGQSKYLELADKFFFTERNKNAGNVQSTETGENFRKTEPPKAA